MKFFTQSELASIYGKPFTQISPTDHPQEKYMAGHKETNCPECGSELSAQCAGTNSFAETVYCPTCELKGRRNRKLLAEDVDYQSPRHRVDEREEYICSDCKQRHPFLVPDGKQFIWHQDPQLHSYETITLHCPCGNRISFGTSTTLFEYTCEKCSRTYTLSTEKT
jgi:transcription elongation factor Elf1